MQLAECLHSWCVLCSCSCFWHKVFFRVECLDKSTSRLCCSINIIDRISYTLDLYFLLVLLTKQKPLGSSTSKPIVRRNPTIAKTHLRSKTATHYSRFPSHHRKSSLVGMPNWQTLNRIHQTLMSIRHVRCPCENRKHIQCKIKVHTIMTQTNASHERQPAQLHHRSRMVTYDYWLHYKTYELQIKASLELNWRFGREGTARLSSRSMLLASAAPGPGAHPMCSCRAGKSSRQE